MFKNLITKLGQHNHVCKSFVMQYDPTGLNDLPRQGVQQHSCVHHKLRLSHSFLDHTSTMCHIIIYGLLMMCWEHLCSSLNSLPHIMNPYNGKLIPSLRNEMLIMKITVTDKI